jgi:hypothetical protein
LFVNASKRRWSAGFWVKRGWVRDVSNFAYTKRECVGDFFKEWGSFRCRRVGWFVNYVRWVSGILARPHANADAFLVSGGDFKFGVGDESVKGFVPTDEEPRVVDKFKGEISLRNGVDSV